MLLGFDFTSWYATTIYVVGGVLVLVAAAEKLYGWSRWLHRKVRPEPLIPPPGQHRRANQRGPQLRPGRGRADPSPRLDQPEIRDRNDGPDYAIRDVTTGVRRRDRPGDYQFDWHRPDIPPLTHRTVEGVEIPPKMFRDVHESVAQEAFVFWARFLAAGGRWEVTRDAHTKQAGEQFNPPPLERPDRTRPEVREAISETADLIAECPECGMLFAVPRADRPQRTSFAAVAKLAGALDFGREVDCPECAAIVKLRPGSTVEVGGDDGVEREPIVVVPGPRQRHQTSPCRKTR